jgi:hypothetical protein
VNHTVDRRWTPSFPYENVWRGGWRSVEQVHFGKDAAAWNITYGRCQGLRFGILSAGKADGVPHLFVGAAEDEFGDSMQFRFVIAECDFAYGDLRDAKEPVKDLTNRIESFLTITSRKTNAQTRTHRTKNNVMKPLFSTRQGINDQLVCSCRSRKFTIFREKVAQSPHAYCTPQTSRGRLRKQSQIPNRVSHQTDGNNTNPTGPPLTIAAA